MSYRCFKIIIITLIAVICLCLGIGIWASIPRKNNVGDKAVYNGSSLYSISNTKLIYDENTRVIYYWLHSGYMSPYYNAHGQLCRYIDGEIVPIEQGG